MRLDLYQAETARIAAEQKALLNAARSIIDSGKPLSALEQSGVLHALQIIIENAIGKAKHRLKAKNQPVPVSAYDTFQALANINAISQDKLPEWNAVIGLRNRIVHDYMNIEFEQIVSLIKKAREQFIIDFLLEQERGNE
ncbi:hypothetical protein MASR1M60_07550 [Rhodocyclaceae bacterium]